MAETATAKDLMRVDEAAAELGVHRDTMYRWIDEGRVPAIRLGEGPKARIRVSRIAMTDRLGLAA